MLRNLALLTSLSLGALGLSGCHLYIEEHGDEPPEAWPDEPRGDEPRDDEPGRDNPEPRPIPCEADEECEAGCYCSDEGFCEESSLCRLDQDCREGFSCDEGTCVPDDEDIEPPRSCEDLGEDACLGDSDCAPVYRGVNCTSESGEPCTSDTAECTCESFAFSACEAA